MPWIIIAAIATASSVSILTLVNVYLYSRYRERFMKLWAIAWGIHVLRYLFLIWSVVWPASIGIKAINYLCILASAVVLIRGTRDFIGRPPPKLPTIIGSIIGLWIIGSLFSGLPSWGTLIPLFAFLSFTYIHIGIQLLKKAEPGEVATHIVAWLFVVWGVHQADYPLLRPIEWFAPWGFLIGSVLATSIAIGMILIYFERAQSALHEKDERFSNVIESSQNWIWELDARGVYTFASYQLKDTLGYSPEEIIGKTPFDLMPAAEADRVRKIFDAISSKRAPFTRLENTNLHKDGRLVVLESNGVPFYDGQGNYLGYRGMDHDITNRKLAETYKEMTREALLVLDEATELKVTLGRLISLLKARTGFDAVGIRLQEGEDYPYYSEDGLPRDLFLKENSLLERSANGGICQDNNGKACLECTCGLVIAGRIEPGHPLFTPGGSFWTNDSFALLELPPDQEPRHNPRNECIHHGYVSMALVPIRDMEKIVGLIQFNDRRKDRFTLASVELLEGVAAHLGAALIRKTAAQERKQLEAQLLQSQKMESVGRLAGGVAHDFNNMLSVILGHASMGLMKTDATHPLHNHLLEINNAAERSADLTRQLLAFARKQAIEPKVLDLNDVISGMLKMLQRMIGEGIDIRWHPGTDAWQVKMDPTQIGQIMANLCVNARDAIGTVGKIFIETGMITLDAPYCLKHPEARKGDYVWLSVSDDGCGMDKETLSHIFEPFFTSKGVGVGTGLGLSTVYGIARQNDGFINVYSEPGHGSSFTIYFPRHLGTTVPAEGADSTMAPVSGNETILLVEDEPAILQMASILLRNLGYTVLAAGSPTEAVRVAGEYSDPIHLLMTDVVMPEMNGRDLATNLTAIDPTLKCLYMSGYTADVIAHHGVIDAGLHFIQKPFTLPTLASKLREILDGESQAR